MQGLKILFVLVTGFALGAGARAADDTSAQITASIQKLVPGAAIQAIAPAPIAGFSSVVVEGNVVYVSNDGRYLIQGSVFDLATRTDLGAAVLAATRLRELKALTPAREIAFPAATPKYSITVFTDIDCPFCRRFHSQIAEFNKQGISVNYVLFPLESLHPDAVRKAEAVWCAKDRQATYTAAMAGADPGQAKCDNPIEWNLAFGRRMGVSHTPAMIAVDGSEIPPGVAQSPTQLAAALAQIAARQ